MPKISDASRCSFDRSSPIELTRSAPYRLRGSGIFACGAPSGTTFDASSTGSATRSLIATFSSAMRFTNEVFAPFSSRRRTRYASSVSCVPTGA
jgi:hypothetical protein